MSDELRLQGVMKEGYGIIPKLVMRDKDLSIEAKSIYSYMCSYSGNGSVAFPRVKTICADLKISEDRFFKHRKPLIEKGYITVKKNTKAGKFDNNIYIINSEIAVPLNCRHGDLPTRQNKGAINNKVINNNKVKNSSSSATQFYESNIGMITPFVAENIVYWIETTSEDLVIEAMKIAVKSNKKFNYAEGILKDWLKNNVKTIEDVEAKKVEFENKFNHKKQNSIMDIGYNPEVDSF